MRRARLEITVTERGNLESCVTVDGICEVNAQQIKIISLVPEGTKVKKGEIVCKFDSSEIDKNIAQQDIKVKQANAKIETTQQELEIQRNKGESDIIAAKVELTLAKLDLEKYVEGDYPGRDHQAEGRDPTQEKRLEGGQEQARSVQAAHEEGVQVPGTGDRAGICGGADRAVLRKRQARAEGQAEVRLQEEDDRVQREGRAGRRRRSSRPSATLKAQMSKAASEDESARATADIEQRSSHEFLKQKDKTVIRAGKMAWSPTPTTPGTTPAARSAKGPRSIRCSESSRLPDMTKMQVKLNIHESLIKKIKVGQKAEIRIESFPSLVFVRHGDIGLAACRFDPPLADRRRQAISHRRQARRPQSARRSSPA